MSIESAYIWMDGEFVPFHDAKVHVLSHSLHYGLGVFEGIRSYEQPGGGGGVFAVQKAAKGSGTKKQRGGTNGPAAAGAEPDGLKPTSELEKRGLHQYQAGTGDAATIEHALKCLPCTGAYPGPDRHATFVGKICVNVCFDGTVVDGKMVPCARAALPSRRCLW